uniref:NUC153 domain-containing protein n=1 Tax=Elaeophora elaphi TaxID=1147741 RepID=A0A0R3RLR5_9BILA
MFMYPWSVSKYKCVLVSSHLKNSKKLAEGNDNANNMEHTCQMDKAPTRKKNSKKNSKKFPEDMKSKEQRNSTGPQEGVRSINPSKNAHKKNHRTFEQFNSTIDVGDDRLRAYGINPKKYKNKLFRRQQNYTREDAKRNQ